ncbi:MAG: aminoacyl-tRNA hydrolase [Fidelibacterota bacterium]
MQVFVGLGNPGSHYAETKHNAGFWIVDALSQRWNLPLVSGRGDYVFARSEDKDILIVKPTTGMNMSGVAVKQVAAQWRISSEDIMVMVDDVDLPLGVLRLRPKGGDGCHKGLESVVYHLGTTNFPRLRFGIATDENTRPAEAFVLKPFRKKDVSLAREMVMTATEAVESILQNGLTKTMNEYNKRD